MEPAQTWRTCYGMTIRTKGSFTRQTREVLKGAWDFDQVYLIAEQIAQQMNHGWHWLVEDAREAVVAAKIFHVVRASSRADEAGVRAADMDKLYLGVRLVLRLTTEEEAGL